MTTIIHLEGLVGVGKSTLLRALAADGYAVVHEDVPSWRDCGGVNLLHHFYKEPARYGRLFQQLTLHTQVRGVMRALRTRPPVLFVERSLRSNRVFACMLRNIIPAEDVGVYDAAWEAAAACMEVVPGVRALHVMLEADPQVCAARVAERASAAADGEDAIDVGYLQELQTAHEGAFANCGLLRLETDGRSVDDVKAELLQFTAKERCSQLPRRQVSEYGQGVCPVIHHQTQ